MQSCLGPVLHTLARPIRLGRRYPPCPVDGGVQSPGFVGGGVGVGGLGVVGGLGLVGAGFVGVGLDEPGGVGLVLSFVDFFVSVDFFDFFDLVFVPSSSSSGVIGWSIRLLLSCSDSDCATAVSGGDWRLF